MKLVSKKFSDCIVNTAKHYYGISNILSKTSKLDYINFLNKIDLYYEICDLHKKKDIVSNVELLIKSDEVLFNIDKIRNKMRKKLKLFDVFVKLNHFIDDLPEIII